MDDNYYNKTEKCPHCGGSNIGEGYQSGYAAVSVRGRALLGDTIIHRICSDCGTVVRSYVKHPARFKPKDKKEY